MTLIQNLGDLIMWTLLIVIGLAVNAVACGKGAYEYNGNCVVDIKPESAPPVKPDKAEAPQTHNDPWRAEGVNIFNAPNLRDQDIKADQEKAQAEAEGKAAAGIPSTLTQLNTNDKK